MPQLPILSGKKLVAVFARIDYRADRQRGSHIRLVHTERNNITVPDYASIDRGLLKKILRDADVSPDEFLHLYKMK
jgi:predicted RNA binding protein YcfA (HicA-like mRNA interferase family)